MWAHVVAKIRSGAFSYTEALLWLLSCPRAYVSRGVDGMWSCEVVTSKDDRSITRGPKMDEGCQELDQHNGIRCMVR